MDAGAGIVVPRTHFQTRNVVSLQLDGAVLTPGEEFSLSNETTAQPLVDRATDIGRELGRRNLRSPKLAEMWRAAASLERLDVKTKELLATLTDKTNDQLRWKAKEFGILEVDASGRVIGFVEKPPGGRPIPCQVLRHRGQ